MLPRLANQDPGRTIFNNISNLWISFFLMKIKKKLDFLNSFPLVSKTWPFSEKTFGKVSTVSWFMKWTQKYDHVGSLNSDCWTILLRSFKKHVSISCSMASFQTNSKIFDWNLSPPNCLPLKRKGSVHSCYFYLFTFLLHFYELYLLVPTRLGDRWWRQIKFYLTFAWKRWNRKYRIVP